MSKPAKQSTSRKGGKQRRVTQARIRQHLGGSRQHLSYVLNGHRESDPLLARVRVVVRAWLSSGYTISDSLRRKIFGGNQ